MLLMLIIEYAIALTWYVLIDDAYQELVRVYRPWRRRGPQPRFSDSEVITVAVIVETYFAGHEELGLSFLHQYRRDLFPQLLDQSRFNGRRRQLGMVIEQVRHAPAGRRRPRAHH